MLYSQTWIDSFIAQVRVDPDDPDACHEWQGTRNGDGYGLVYRLGERYAHRHSYRIFVGGIPPGKVVRHRCDNPSCVNPAHLILGTRADNNKDALERNRHAKGSCRRPDVTEEMVRLAREDFHAGRINTVQAAERIKMSRSQTSDVLWGRLWRHVDMPEGVAMRPRRKKLKRDRRTQK